MNKRNFLLFVFLSVCILAYPQLPSMRLKTMEGKEIMTDTIARLNHGRPVIVDFFATWCKPCNRGLSAISEVYDEWVAETGVKLIAVSIDQAQNVHKVKPLVDANGWPFDVLLDPNSDFRRALGIQMIPYTLIIDGEGHIVYRHYGYTDGGEEEYIRKVREIVKP